MYSGVVSNFAFLFDSIIRIQKKKATNFCPRSALKKNENSWFITYTRGAALACRVDTTFVYHQPIYNTIPIKLHSLTVLPPLS